MSDDRIISADEARRLLNDWQEANARGACEAPHHRYDTEMTVCMCGPCSAKFAALNNGGIASPDLAASVIALHDRLATLDVELARGIAERETLRRERDEARAIIAGRDTPPTDEEIAVHQAQGGEWLGFRADGPPWRRGAVIADFTYSEEHVRAAHRCARWWALDAEGRPCAWPKVTP